MKLRRFNGEYVAVEVLELDPQHVITRGIVIAHGTDKAALREALRARNPRQSALLCLAPRPKTLPTCCETAARFSDW